MKKLLLPVFCFILFALLVCPVADGQTGDFVKSNSYKKVFVETDNFDTSYLKTLEESYEKAKDDRKS